MELLERLAGQLQEQGELTPEELADIDLLLDDMAEAEGEQHAELAAQKELLQFRNDELDVSADSAGGEVPEGVLTQELLDCQRESRDLAKAISEQQAALEALRGGVRQARRESDDLWRKEQYLLQKNLLDRRSIGEANSKAVTELAHQARLRDLAQGHNQRISQMRAQLRQLGQSLRAEDDEGERIGGVLKELCLIHDQTQRQRSQKGGATYRK